MRITVVFALAALMAAAAGTVGVAKAGAACTKVEFYETSPASSGDGGRGSWVLRAMTAPNYASGGFTAQVLWVGTGGQDAGTDWVEVGATQGWQGSNIYTYYTAQGKSGGATYSERRITLTPGGYGTTHRFSSFKNASAAEYWAAIDGAGQYSWPNHTTPTIEWSMGFETTCGETAKVNRTYVSENQWRRPSDQVWINASSATNHSVNGSVGGGFAWCSYPLTFRYFLHSDLDQTICG